MNGLADKLAIASSTLQPSDEIISRNGRMETNFRPSILDNVDHCQVFNDDDPIIRFLKGMDEFETSLVSQGMMKWKVTQFKT